MKIIASRSLWNPKDFLKLFMSVATINLITLCLIFSLRGTLIKKVYLASLVICCCQCCHNSLISFIKLKWLQLNLFISFSLTNCCLLLLLANAELWYVSAVLSALPFLVTCKQEKNHAVWFIFLIYLFILAQAKLPFLFTDHIFF